MVKNEQEIRLQLLAGLLDSDGYLFSDKGCFEISQKRKNLAEKICFLCRSLGFRAVFSYKKTTINSAFYLFTSGLHFVLHYGHRFQNLQYSVRIEYNSLCYMLRRCDN